MVSDARGEVPGSLRGDDSSYTGYRRVGVRLMEEFDRTLVDSRKAIDSENDFTRGLQWFDKAHTVMLVEEGIIPRDGARRAARGAERGGCTDFRLTEDSSPGACGRDGFPRTGPDIPNRSGTLTLRQRGRGGLVRTSRAGLARAREAGCRRRRR